MRYLIYLLIFLAVGTLIHISKAADVPTPLMVGRATGVTLSPTNFNRSNFVAGTNIILYIDAQGRLVINCACVGSTSVVETFALFFDDGASSGDSLLYDDGLGSGDDILYDQ